MNWMEAIFGRRNVLDPRDERIAILEKRLEYLTADRPDQPGGMAGASPPIRCERCVQSHDFTRVAVVLAVHRDDATGMVYHEESGGRYSCQQCGHEQVVSPRGQYRPHRDALPVTMRLPVPPKGAPNGPAAPGKEKDRRPPIAKQRPTP